MLYHISLILDRQEHECYVFQNVFRESDMSIVFEQGNLMFIEQKRPECV